MPEAPVEATSQTPYPLNPDPKPSVLREDGIENRFIGKPLAPKQTADAARPHVHHVSGQRNECLQGERHALGYARSQQTLISQSHMRTMTTHACGSASHFESTPQREDKPPRSGKSTEIAGCVAV